MDKDLLSSRISIGLHMIVATFVGYLSLYIQMASRALFGIGVGVVILIVTGYAAQFITKEKGIKWWAGNGLVVYLFMWLVSWVMFFNLGL